MTFVVLSLVLCQPYESVMLSLVLAIVSLLGLHCYLSLTHAKNSDNISFAPIQKVILSQKTAIASQLVS